MVNLQYKTLKIAHNDREIHRNIKMDLYHI